MSDKSIRVSRRSLLAGVTAIGAGAHASGAEAAAKKAQEILREAPGIMLEQAIPRQFGEWRLDPAQGVLVVNPQTQQLLDKLKTESVGHFASGWGWLILNNGKLEVTSLHDGDSPIAHGMTPLLTLDVWEHAYYIDYRNARPVFVDTVLNNLINWEFVAQNLDGNGVSRADQG